MDWTLWLRKMEESRRTRKILARATRSMAVTFPKREEAEGNRFDREISSILDMLNLRCQ